jgi:hypothetical protein
VPLSEHEQRLFDQIEQSLAKDPKFASAVRATDPRFHTRRRVIIAILIGILGFALLIAGPITKAPVIGVVGFVVALGALIFGAQSVRRGRNGGTLKAVGGNASRQTRVRRVSFIDRLEDRWRGRPEGQ